ECSPLGLRRKPILPRRHALPPIRRSTLQLAFDLTYAAENFLAFRLLLGLVDRNIRVVGVVEEGKNTVVLLLAQRIVLMVVALGTLNRDPENALTDGIHPIVHGLHTELLGIDAALFVDHGVAQEAGRDTLVLRGTRQQVACNLFD